MSVPDPGPPVTGANSAVMVSCVLPVLLGPETENVSTSPPVASRKLLPRMAVMLCLTGGIWSQSLPSPDSAMEKMKLHQDYLGALAELEELLQVPNPSPVIYYLAGVCQTSLRNYPEAVENFQQAMDKGLDSWELRLSLGVAYARMGRDPDARRELELVLQLRPEEPTALFHLGELDLKNGLYPAAERNFRKVLRLNPGHENILFNLGTSLLRQGKETEGRAVLKNHRRRAHLRGRLKTLRWMSASPRANAEVFADLGDANLETGDERAALEAYSRAERLDPGTHLTGFGRGKLSFGRGDLYGAGTHLRRYLDRGGQNCETFLLLALVERRTQRHREARDTAVKGLELCPQDVGLLSTAARLEMEGGNLDETGALADRIMRADPTDPSGPFIKALSLLYRKRMDEAEDMARKALELNDQDPRHHQLLERIYQSRGAFEKARFHGDRARELGRKMKREE